MPWDKPVTMTEHGRLAVTSLSIEMCLLTMGPVDVGANKGADGWEGAGQTQAHGDREIGEVSCPTGLALWEQAPEASGSSWPRSPSRTLSSRTFHEGTS